jgi:hypothetical protein
LIQLGVPLSAGNERRIIAWIQDDEPGEKPREALIIKGFAVQLASGHA